MASKRGAVSRVAQRVDDDEQEPPRRRKKVRVGIDPRLIQRALSEAHVETFGTADPRPTRKPRKRRVRKPAVTAASTPAAPDPTIVYSRVERVSDAELARLRRRLEGLHDLIRTIAAVVAEWKNSPTVRADEPTKP